MIYFLFIAIIACELTPYSQQETHQIRLQQQDKWQSANVRLETTSSYSCVVKNILPFFIEAPSEKVKMSMRGRVYIMEKKGHITQQQYISPMDSSKVYVYSPRGIIVASAQFYEKFGLQWTVDANQSFKIVFQDGPPGPQKLFVWDLDIGNYHQMSTIPQIPFSPSYMDPIESRLTQLSFFLTDIQSFNEVRMIAQRQAFMNFLSQNANYQWFLWGECVVVCFVVWCQISVISRMLKSSTGIVI